MLQPMVGSVYAQIRAVVSTNNLQLAVGKTLEIYNVGAPGDTNYEKGTISWATNVLTFQASAGGTGTQRATKMLSGDGSGVQANTGGSTSFLGSGSNLHTLTTPTDGIGFYMTGRIVATTTTCLNFGNGAGGSNFSASSGTQKLARFFGTVNQSSTAAFVGLEVDVTPTSVGSGTVMGLSIKRAATEVFAIDTKAALSSDADTVMFLTYHSSGTVKHARVTLGADSGGQRVLRVAT